MKTELNPLVVVTKNNWVLIGAAVFMFLVLAFFIFTLVAPLIFDIPLIISQPAASQAPGQAQLSQHATVRRQ